MVTHGLGSKTITPAKRLLGLSRKLFLLTFWGTMGIFSLLVFFVRSENHDVKAALVSVRDCLESDYTTDTHLLDLTPEQLVSRGFKTDSKQSILAFRAEMMRIPAYAGVLNDIEQTGDEIEKARKIVLSYSISGEHRGIHRMPLLAKLEQIRNGDGLCSDYTQVFLAIAQATGLWAREVQNDRHSFIGFYSYSRSSWIFIDPMLAILAKDTQGSYLSPFKLRKYRLEDKPVTYECFGAGTKPVTSTASSLFQFCYGERDRFARFALTYGNNVIAEDQFEQRQGWMPWELQKLMVVVSGVHPRVLNIADAHSKDEVQNTQWLKEAVLCGGVFWLAGMTLFPLASFARTIRILSRRLFGYKINDPLTDGEYRHAQQSKV